MLMRRTRALLVFLSPVLSACQPRSAALTDVDRNGIRAVTDNFAKAALAADWAAAASAYAEDGIVLPPNGPAVQGRAAIQTFLATFPKLMAFKLSLVEIDGHGDLAYTRGTYELTLLPPGAKGPVRDTGKFLEIRRKQPDGSWPVVRDIWNSDLAAAK